MLREVGRTDAARFRGSVLTRKDLARLLTAHEISRMAMSLKLRDNDVSLSTENVDECGTLLIRPLEEI